MKLKLDSFVKAMEGRANCSSLVYVKRNNQTIGMSRAQPKQVESQAQHEARMAMSQVRDAWRALTDEQRAGWQAFTVRYYRNSEVWPTSLNVFTRTALARIYRGLQPRMDAPVFQPPAAVHAVAMVPLAPDASPTTLEFAVTHGWGDMVSGLVMTVKVTPPTSSPGRMPNLRNVQLVHGMSPESSIPLPPSGTVVSFENIYTQLKPGCRFGMEIVVSRADEGVPGERALFRLVRSGEK